MLVAADWGTIISTTAVVVAAIVALVAVVAAWMTVSDGRRATREHRRDRLLDCIGNHGATVISGLTSSATPSDVAQLLVAASRITLEAAITATNTKLLACDKLANEGEINLTSSPDDVRIATKNALDEVVALPLKQWDSGTT
jgi:hypothetical protein